MASTAREEPGDSDLKNLDIRTSTQSDIHLGLENSTHSFPHPTLGDLGVPARPFYLGRLSRLCNAKSVFHVNASGGFN